MVTAAENTKRPVRVLVADDEPDARELLCAQLRHEGIEIVGVAVDTDEAVRMARVLSPDVALLDWMMPGGGGGRATREMQASSPKVRVVGISAATGEDPQYDMLTAGAVGFLRKGCSRPELAESIRSALRW